MGARRFGISLRVFNQNIGISSLRLSWNPIQVLLILNFLPTSVGINLNL